MKFFIFLTSLVCLDLSLCLGDTSRLSTYAKSAIWRSYLHWRPALLGPGVSRIQKDSKFFLSKEGSTNPEAELIASLQAFADPEHHLLEGGGHPNCFFPARLKILKKYFGIKEAPVNCPALTDWRRKTLGQKVALVFASQYIANPGSFMGHTLLKFIDPSREDYMNYAVGYAGDMPDDVGGLSYIYKGIGGGFPGIFSAVPYYQKVHEFNNMERRDVWEYTLNLSQEQVSLLSDILWELYQSAEFRYFFFDENCAFELLVELQTIAPEKNLTSGFPIYVLPGESIKKVNRAGLIESENFRPSIRRTLMFHYDQLNFHERQNLRKTLTLSHVPEGASVDFLDTILDGLSLQRQLSMGKLEPPLLELEKSALLARAQKGLAPRTVPPRPVSPLDGHGGYRFHLGSGARNQRSSYWRLGVSPFVHDLADKDAGYVENTALEVLAFDLHFDPTGQGRLNQLTIFKVTNLSEMNLLDFNSSWQLWVQSRGDEFETCIQCQVPSFDYAYGVSWKAQPTLDMALLVHADWEPGDNAGAGEGFWPGLLFYLSYRPQPQIKLLWMSTADQEIKRSERLSRFTSKIDLRYYDWHPQTQISLRFTSKSFASGPSDFQDLSLSLIRDF